MNVERVLELQKLPKAELALRVRRLGWIGGYAPPERWTKEELAKTIAVMEGER